MLFALFIFVFTLLLWVIMCIVYVFDKYVFIHFFLSLLNCLLCLDVSESITDLREHYVSMHIMCN